VLREGQEVPDDYERTVMTTLAFKRVAESVLKSQLTFLIVGSLVILVSVIIAVAAGWAIPIIGSLLGALLVGYGWLAVKPKGEVRLSKAYCSFASAPYDDLQLAFDLNGYIGNQRFDYSTIRSDEISAKLGELPKDLAIENEDLLIKKLNEIVEVAKRSKQDSISIPVAARDHIIVGCMQAAASMCRDGRPSNELPILLNLEDCLKHVSALQTLEMSHDVVSFLENAASRSTSASGLFTKQLETNLNTLERYFAALAETIKQRLFGGFSYDKAADEDVESFVTYRVNRVPEFANIVRPFQTVIDELYRPLRLEIEKAKHDFETGKLQLLRDLERDQRRIDMDTEREVRSIQREVEAAKRHADSIRSRKYGLEAEIKAEESVQRLREPQYRDWSYVETLRSRLSEVEDEVRNADASVSRLNTEIKETYGEADREKRRLKHDTDNEIEKLRHEVQNSIKDMKNPILRIQETRDQVIDLGNALLLSAQAEREIQRAPYLERVNRITQARDLAVSTLRGHSESRKGLIQQIKDTKNRLPFENPTQVSIPYWFMEITSKSGSQRFIDSIVDIARPEKLAKNWTRDFTELGSYRAPFSSYVQSLGGQAFEQAARYSISSAEMLSAAKGAEALVDQGIISQRCHSKMIEFFGGTRS
jgi:hypothetical protein